MTYQLAEDQWDDEALPLDWCIAPTIDGNGICRNETSLLDSFGLPWCEEHRFRSEFLAWGRAHRYPALQMEPFAVAEGASHWGIAATQGIEDMIWLLMGAIEMIEDKESNIA